MLVKLKEVDKKGKTLYLNAITGDTTTLVNAKFFSSQRRDKRGNINSRAFSNRKGKGEMFLQRIDMGNKTKFVAHYTNSSLMRKEMFLNFLTRKS